MPDYEKQDSTQQQRPVDDPLSLKANFPDPKSFVASLRTERRQASRVVMEEIRLCNLWGETEEN